MNWLSIGSIDPVEPMTKQLIPNNTGEQIPESNGIGFFDYLKEALREVDVLQKQSEASAERLALGDENYLHNTVLAYQKATLAFQLTVEVRDKVIEAYQEIMRMQM